MLELKAVHKCFLIETTEKIDSKVTVFSARPYKNLLECVAKVQSPEIKNYLEILKKHPQVKSLKPIFTKGDTSVVLFVVNADGTLHKAVFDSKCILAEPTLTADGLDFVTIIAPSQKNINQLFENFDESYDAKILKKRSIKEEDLKNLNSFVTSGFFKFKSISEQLTPRQKEVFELACKSGYYSIPRKITLTELAKELKISESAVSKHLRLVEQRVLPTLKEVLEKF